MNERGRIVSLSNKLVTYIPLQLKLSIYAKVIMDGPMDSPMDVCVHTILEMWQHTFGMGNL